jgi:hypothetical protein
MLKSEELIAVSAFKRSSREASSEKRVELF